MKNIDLIVALGKARVRLGFLGALTETPGQLRVLADRDRATAESFASLRTEAVRRGLVDPATVLLL